MVALHAVRLEILALDAAVARLTQRVVENVVVPLAVGLVVEHIELRRREGLLARCANETFLKQKKTDTQQESAMWTCHNKSTTPDAGQN